MLLDTFIVMPLSDSYTVTLVGMQGEQYHRRNDNAGSQDIGFSVTQFMESLLHYKFYSEKGYLFHSFIWQSVLRQVQSLFQSELST